MTRRVRELNDHERVDVQHDHERVDVQRIAGSHTLGAALVRRAQIVVYALVGLLAGGLAPL